MIRSIVEKHVDEASFLWILRDSAAIAPNYTRDEIARLDMRLEAHLDGLRVAGDMAWEVCKEALDYTECGEVFTAAEIAVELGDIPHLAQVMNTAGIDPRLRRGIISAVAWAPYERVAGVLEAMVEPECPQQLRFLGIAGYALHRRDPGQALRTALRAGYVDLRARAARAVGELGLRELLPELHYDYESEEPSARYWSTWAGALLGDPAALKAQWTYAKGNGNDEAQGDYGLRARELVYRGAPKNESAGHLEQLLADPEQIRTAILGTAAIGDPARIPWLLECLAVPELARLAAHAICMVTGIRLQEDVAEGDRPEGFAAGPSDDPADDNVALDPDRDLLWPDPEAVAKLWSERKQAFQPGHRYLLGRPIDEQWLGNVLRFGSQCERRAAALELSLAKPGTVLVETRSPGYRQ